MRFLTKATLAGAALTVLASSGALAAPVTGGTTVIEGPFTNFGVGLAGTAFLAEPVNPVNIAVGLPITGGEITGAAGVIEHEGSGLLLFTAGGMDYIGNFAVSLTDGTVTGDRLDADPDSGAILGVRDDGLDLFSLGDESDGLVELLVGEDLADILTGTLGVSGTPFLGDDEPAELEGSLFGFVRTDPTLGDGDGAPIPLPAGLLLVLTGTAALAAAGRRRAV